MKGNKKIIERLNELLADELTAISQYIVHAEMCDNWGYIKLHDSIKKRAIEEMGHAEKLIERILFLEGQPIIEHLNKITIGTNLEEQFKSDRQAEEGAIKMYNNSIHLAEDSGDNGTGELLKSVLLDEEAHLDWLETQLELIKQLEVKNYLMEQV